MSGADQGGRKGDDEMGEIKDITIELGHVAWAKLLEDMHPEERLYAKRVGSDEMMLILFTMSGRKVLVKHHAHVADRISAKNALAAQRRHEANWRKPWRELAYIVREWFADELIMLGMLVHPDKSQIIEVVRAHHAYLDASLKQTRT